MGQRAEILTQVLGFWGWKVTGHLFERADGTPVMPIAGYDISPEVRLVLQVERRWKPRCPDCGLPCEKQHGRLGKRRWADQSWAGRSTFIEYAPIRVSCPRCQSTPTEMVAWADPYQRQTRRLQHYLTIEAASMPVSHVAALHGLDWSTVRRAEECAIKRWEQTQYAEPLIDVGVDEKWLGRRHKRAYDYVTIVSNNRTGEPLWIGHGRTEKTLKKWLRTKTKEQKAAMRLFVMDMHKPFWNAVVADKALAHVAIVHDPFHVMKRANEALDELRREAFFRAGPDLRAIGRGAMWVVRKAWDYTTADEKKQLKLMFRLNRGLARGYQIVEELRVALRVPGREEMEQALAHVARRTARKDNAPLRGLHDSLLAHWHDIVALGEFRPATGRVEALNNNWETLVRVSRGCRNYEWLRQKLRFMIANPIRTERGLKRFQALGLPTPMQAAA